MMFPLKPMRGMYRVEMVCADPIEVMDAIRKKNIQLYKIELKEDLCAIFYVARHDYERLYQYADHRGISLEVAESEEIFWKIRNLMRRKILIWTVVALFLLTLWLPSRILFVRVEGNCDVPAKQILEAAEQIGVRFGASRRLVRSEKVKNTLLARIPQLQWVGVNTRGTEAIISVRERPLISEEKDLPKVSSIIASRDGVIISSTVTGGTGLCAPGEIVQAGQVLISGFADCGRTVVATRAEGEIFAETNRAMSVKTPSFWMKRDGSGDVMKNHSLILGKKRINFYKGSGIYGGSCVKMYSKYVLTLPGGFSLPVAWICEEIRTGLLTEEPVAPEFADVLLTGFAERYLKQSMIAGSILERLEVTSDDGGHFTLTGNYVCREMIGRNREEVIGEYHGKDNGADRERGSGG